MRKSKYLMQILNQTQMMTILEISLRMHHMDLILDIKEKNYRVTGSTY